MSRSGQKKVEEEEEELCEEEENVQAIYPSEDYIQTDHTLHMKPRIRVLKAFENANNLKSTSASALLFNTK